MENEGGRDLSVIREVKQERQKEINRDLWKRKANTIEGICKKLRGHERKKIKTTFEDHLLPKLFGRKKRETEW